MIVAVACCCGLLLWLVRLPCYYFGIGFVSRHRHDVAELEGVLEGIVDGVYLVENIVFKDLFLNPVNFASLLE